MKKNLKRIMSVLLSIFLFVTVIPNIASAQSSNKTEQNSINQIVASSQVETAANNDDVFKTYESNNFKMLDSNITEITKDGLAIMSANYKDGLRILKEGQSSSVFEYDNGLLKKEIRDGNVIEYLYIIKDGRKHLDGFIINKESYYYIWNDKNLISGISNSNGKLLAKYIYDGLVITDVLENNGVDWVTSNDTKFIGNYNKIRLYGSYWDDETGWYYHNGVYEDTVKGKIIGLIDNDDVLKFDPNEHRSEYELLSVTELELQAEQWRQELLNNSSYNSSRSSNWYENSSYPDVEIIARMIYGENTSNLTDHRAISYIIMNRYNAQSSEFGLTLRRICGNPAQFNGVASPNAMTAKNPNDSGWRNATYVACLLLITPYTNDWDQLGMRPTGITNQKWFRSADKLHDLSQFKYENGQLYTYYAYSGKYIAITNACIAGVGVYTTITGLENACGGNTGNYNVFFHHN